MIHPIVRFFVLLIGILGVVFITHLTLLYFNELPLFENKILMCYWVNALFALLVVGFLYKFRKKFKSQLGFLFMGGSLLKFAVFFLVFYPFFNTDGELSKLEFITFFVPYTVSLILETITLSKILNKLDTTLV
ncbi:DUF6168 family protein [Psychroserpens sp. S379A]|uniref:DUF6168 family protein n=1 Tax=Psychroserpens sp. S379A TaxID=3415137 RepID=UPI003C7D0ECC